MNKNNLIISAGTRLSGVIIGNLKKSGVKVTRDYKKSLRTILKDADSINEMSFNDILYIYETYLRAANNAAHNLAVSLIFKNSYDKKTFFGILAENKAFKTNRDIASAIKTYLRNKFWSKEHRNQIESLFKIYASYMGQDIMNLEKRSLK